MPNDKGFLDMHQPMKKTQPAAVPDRSSEEHGDGHDFNLKAKVTNNYGDYQDFTSKQSGLSGNFSEKDASMEYLRSRNKLGQEVKNFSATEMQSRLKIYGGATAYDGMPIPETYKPATSQGNVPPNAIEYKTEQKDRNLDTGYQEDTMANNLPSRVTKHVKSK